MIQASTWGADFATRFGGGTKVTLLDLVEFAHLVYLVDIYETKKVSLDDLVNLVGTKVTLVETFCSPATPKKVSSWYPQKTQKGHFWS